MVAVILGRCSSKSCGGGGNILCVSTCTTIKNTIGVGSLAIACWAWTGSAAGSWQQKL